MSNDSEAKSTRRAGGRPRPPARSTAARAFPLALLALSACSQVLGVGDLPGAPSDDGGSAFDASSTDGAGADLADGASNGRPPADSAPGRVDAAGPGLDGGVDVSTPDAGFGSDAGSGTDASSATDGTDAAGTDGGNDTTGADAAPEASGDGGSTCDAQVCPSWAIATGQGTISGLAVDGTNAYWVATLGPIGPTSVNAFMRCDKTGCNNRPTQLVTTPSDVPGLLVIDSNTAYWIGTGSAVSSDSILTCGLTGCAQATPLASGLPGTFGIALDATNVYWAAVNGPEFCPKSGCTAPSSLANPSTGAAWAIAVQAGHAYWTTSNGDVDTCDLSNCNASSSSASAVSLVTGLGNGSLTSIAVDATNVYFASDNGGNGLVMACALGGCNNKPQTLASGQANPTALAVDATTIYWTNATNNGNLVKCAIGACNNQPTTLASGLNNPRSTVVDATSVYFGTLDGNVGRVPK